MTSLEIKKPFQFKINPEYQKLVPLLESKDYERIKNSIKKHGLKSKIYVNQDGEVLDGHNRIKMCQELGLELDTDNFEIIRFENKLDEREFVIIINLDRRHLEEFQKIELGYELHKIESEKARLRQLSGLRNVKDKVVSLVPIGANEEQEEEENNKSKKGKTSKIISDKIGVPVRTYERGIKVIEKGTEEQKEKLRKGQSTVFKESNIIDAEEKNKKLVNDAQKYKLPNKSQLFNADFREILKNIPDNSIPLIITDPPYVDTLENIQLYEDLGKLAGRVLKPGGSLIFLAGGVIIDEVIARFYQLRKSGLNFWWPYVMEHEGNGIPVHEYGVIAKQKIFLGYFKEGGKEKLKPDALIGLIFDHFKSSKPDKSSHEWAQNSKDAEFFIERLTVENDIVLDPFLGSGAFGIGALKLGRQFIGCEINKEAYTKAEANIKVALGEES